MTTTTNNDGDAVYWNNSTNIFETWMQGKDKKCAWLKTDKYTIGLEISPSSDYAGIGIRHNSKNPKAHNISLGVNDNGRSFLQVSDGEKIKTVDLFNLISFVADLMKEKGLNDELNA
jgi:hypothetical protein